MVQILPTKVKNGIMQRKLNIWSHALKCNNIQRKKRNDIYEKWGEVLWLMSALLNTFTIHCIYRVYTLAIILMGVVVKI